ncbi:MAG: ribose 5-phosphate isomerase A [Thermoprotei archaeon]|nr:MAG: ribose 5-phosphate isomerase A [Thermoprotei archaeon]
MSKDIRLAKERAAKKAVEFIKDGQIVGVGSGTTVELFIKILAERIKREGLDIITIPTSFRTYQLLAEYNFKIASLNEYPDLDIAIDGADEVDSHLNLIKGGGAAHTLEKIVDYSARDFIVIVDYRKISNKLCEKRYIPIEVIPIAIKRVTKELMKMGAVDVRLRGGEPNKYGPLITELGNVILDTKFKPLENPESMEREIKTIPGVVEVGIFSGRHVSMVIVGYPDRVEMLKRK